MRTVLPVVRFNIVRMVDGVFPQRSQVRTGSSSVGCEDSTETEVVSLRIYFSRPPEVLIQKCTLVLKIRGKVGN